MGRHRHDAQQPAGLPSRTARTRLAAAVHREVCELRVRSLEAFLRAQALLEAGLVVEANAALDEQRLLLEQLRERVQSAVAAALVEREAEMVLAAVPEAASLLEADEEGAEAARPGLLLRAAGRLVGAVERLPATATTALAAIVALAFLLLGEPPKPSYQGIADLSGTIPAQPVSSASGRAGETRDSVDAHGTGADAVDGLTSARARELREDMRWLLAGPHGLLARIAEESAESVASLLDLDTLAELLDDGARDRPDEPAPRDGDLLQQPLDTLVPPGDEPGDERPGLLPEGERSEEPAVIPRSTPGAGGDGPTGDAPSSPF